MNKEELMKKVEKLLALAGNNPSESEAKAAMLKAQKLIAEYNLDMGEFSKEDMEDIVMVPAHHPGNSGYRVKLAQIIAANFRCRVMMVGNTVNFLGYKTDAEVCVKVFNYAFKISHSKGAKLERIARKNGEPTKGVFTSYCMGFCYGIKSVLDEQCRALMIVVPEDVDKELKKRAGGTYRGGARSRSFSDSAYLKGREDGKNHMRSHQIEGSC